MNKIITVLVLLTIPAFAGMKEDVSKTLNTHFKGIETGDIKLVEQAWLKDQAQISEIKKDEVIKHNTDKSFQLWTKSKNPKLNGQILSVTQITPKLAVAKVSLNWKGSTFTDALTLTKTSNGWKIISKVYAAPKKASSYGL